MQSETSIRHDRNPTAIPYASEKWADDLARTAREREQTLYLLRRAVRGYLSGHPVARHNGRVVAFAIAREVTR